MERLTEERESVDYFEEDDFEAERLYLRDLRKLSTMSEEEEKELAERISRGDRDARRKMIETNLRLVVKIARRYVTPGVSILDLIEEGNIGLIKAVEKFDLSKNCRFSTYATWWIRESIERAVLNYSRIVRLPVHVTSRMRKISKVIQEYIEREGREPTVEEIHLSTDVPVAFIRNVMFIVTKTDSIDTLLDEEENVSTERYLPGLSVDEALSALEQTKRIEYIASWLDRLREDEKRVIVLRYGLDGEEPQTLESIGKLFGVTRERIRQIEHKTIAKLQRVVRRNNIGRETI
ncbi:MAG TPA: sigma-70 family RNA polymerase sigma factor [Syntrophorhabdales bacterium]|nr:sigma-70 family RNA polymerase sigma factor [Syntrophorhabdales bacterium]